MTLQRLKDDPFGLLNSSGEPSQDNLLKEFTNSYFQLKKKVVAMKGAAKHNSPPRQNVKFNFSGATTQKS